MVGVERASSTTERAKTPLNCPPRLWQPRPFTLVVVGCVAVLAFFACFPAIEAPHANLRDETFGLHFNLLTEYEHGWPVRYARRELSHRTAAEGPPSAWRPWDGPGRWSTSGLLMDLLFWGLVIVLAGVGAQRWRSQRRAVWQLGLRDLLILTGIAGVAFAWLADQRAEYLRERASQSSSACGRAMPPRITRSAPACRPGGPNRGKHIAANCSTGLATSIPAAIPTSPASTGTWLLCANSRFTPNFPSICGKCSRLEAIDLCFVELPYFDATRQATILRDLAPLLNLRGINLCKTNATDADMAWLASCPRLEVINLSQTNIGDRGLAQLAKLPRLRNLSVSSDRISDRGCKLIGQIQSLEELSLASRNIHDTVLLSWRSCPG